MSESQGEPLNIPAPSDSSAINADAVPTTSALRAVHQHVSVPPARVVTNATGRSNSSNTTAAITGRINRQRGRNFTQDKLVNLFSAME